MNCLHTRGSGGTIRAPQGAIDHGEKGWQPSEPDAGHEDVERIDTDREQRRLLRDRVARERCRHQRRPGGRSAEQITPPGAWRLADIDRDREQQEHQAHARRPHPSQPSVLDNTEPRPGLPRIRHNIRDLRRLGGELDKHEHGKRRHQPWQRALKPIEQRIVEGGLVVAGDDEKNASAKHDHVGDKLQPLCDNASHFDHSYFSGAFPCTVKS